MGPSRYQYLGPHRHIALSRAVACGQIPEAK
jgi:hypothetical protein